MDKEQCPPLLRSDADPGYSLSSYNRTVDSVISVFCHNYTISVLRCLPQQYWNASYPKCTSSLEVEDAREFKVETIIIIVWVLGGVLLIGLLVLLAIILTSHKKGGRRQPSSSPRTSIFSVTSNRNSRGGDNPAFTTENEAMGQASLHRNGSNRSSLRPPSYHEAVSGRIVCLPGMAARMSPNVARPPPSGSRREVNSPRTRPRREGNGSRGRYVYDYPSCYWEEEPPPPYDLVVGDRPEPSTRVPAAISHPPARNVPPAPQLSRIQHLERPRAQASAPIARLEYDYF